MLDHSDPGHTSFIGSEHPDDFQGGSQEDRLLLVGILQREVNLFNDDIGNVFSDSLIDLTLNELINAN